MRKHGLLQALLAGCLVSCSGGVATGPSPSPTPIEQSPLAYSLKVYVSGGHAGAIRGVISPATLDLAFANPTGKLMSIVSATLFLQDDGGAELARQTFGESQGVLTFKPVWEGGAVGRTVRMKIDAFIEGAVRSFEGTAYL
jgi:hypothetical protein